MTSEFKHAVSLRIAKTTDSYSTAAKVHQHLTKTNLSLGIRYQLTSMPVTHNILEVEVLYLPYANETFAFKIRKNSQTRPHPLSSCMHRRLCNTIREESL